MARVSTPRRMPGRRLSPPLCLRGRHPARLGGRRSRATRVHVVDFARAPPGAGCMTPACRGRTLRLSPFRTLSDAAYRPPLPALAGWLPDRTCRQSVLRRRAEAGLAGRPRQCGRRTVAAVHRQPAGRAGQLRRRLSAVQVRRPRNRQPGVRQVHRGRLHRRADLEGAHVRERAGRAERCRPGRRHAVPRRHQRRPVLRPAGQDALRHRAAAGTRRAARRTGRDALVPGGGCRRRRNRAGIPAHRPPYRGA